MSISITRNLFIPRDFPDRDVLISRQQTRTHRTFDVESCTGEQKGMSMSEKVCTRINYRRQSWCLTGGYI